MLLWENEEEEPEEPEEPLRDHQVEEDRQEEEGLQQLEELPTSQSPQPRMLKQWAKIPLPSTETEAKLIHS